MVEAVVTQEMTRHLLVGLVAVVRVELKVLSFWVPQEVEERDQVVGEAVVRLESEREC